LVIFYRFVSIILGFFYVLFLKEPPKLSIFFHMYLTITRSNIQLDTIFLVKLSSLKSTYPTLIQCKFFFLGINNPIFYVRYAFIYQFLFLICQFCFHMSVWFTCKNLFFILIIASAHRYLYLFLKQETIKI